MSQSLRLNITDPDSLDAARIALLDSRITAEDIEHDPTRHELHVWVRAPDFSAAHYQRIWWCLHRRTVPWCRLHLMMRHVDRCSISCLPEGRPHEYYEISDIHYNGMGSVTINTHYALSIQLTVTRLDGVLSKAGVAADEPPLRSFVLCCR